jgi:hypothetical protein
MFTERGESYHRIDGTDGDRVILGTSGKDLVREPVDVVCFMRSVMIPAVLELDRYDADVPDTGLTVDIGRGKVIAVRVPREASDLSRVPVTCTLQLAVAHERSSDVVLVDCGESDLQSVRLPERILTSRLPVFRLTRHECIAIIVPRQI